MESKEDIYEKNTFSTSDFTNVDLKINPDYYINHCLMKAQQCLVKDNVQDCFLQFRVIVEHL